MRIYNEDYKFSFVVPDDFKEISYDDYEKYNISPYTLHVFVRLVKKEVQVITLTRDDEVKDEKDYESLVNLNLQNMEKAGIEVNNHIHHLSGNRRIDIIYSEMNDLQFATYFTKIQTMLVACSIEIKEIGDERDQVLTEMFDSLIESRTNVPQSYEGDKPFVFISYSHRDSDVVYPFISKLQKFVNVWFDDGIHLGVDFNDDIISHIKKCEVFLFIATEGSLESEYCRKEIRFAAQAKHKNVINIITSEKELADWFVFEYGSIQNFNLYKFKDYEIASQELIQKAPDWFKPCKSH